MIITDEMLKTAWLANHGFPVRRKELKTVLEAVAPMLIAPLEAENERLREELAKWQPPITAHMGHLG